jgi:peptide/nickel transport system substrate-binding protein
MVTASPSAQTAPIPNGISGGKLTIASIVEIPHRDVHQEAQYALTALGPGIAYSRMLQLKTGSDIQQPSLTIECDLCDRWQLNEDFTYEFNIKDDVYWHDVDPMPARRLTAKDIVYSYKRIEAESWHKSNLFSERGLSDFEAISDTVLRISTTFQDSDALLALADGNSKIVAHEIVSKYGNLKNAPVIGTGAWIWDSSSSHTEYVFRKNQKFYYKDLPFLDELVIKILKTPSTKDTGWQTRAAALASGQIDVINISSEEMSQWNIIPKNFKTYQSDDLSNGISLAMNVQSEPFKNQSARKAVLKAIDPWNYIDLMWNGVGGSHIGIPFGTPQSALNSSQIRREYFANPSDARLIISQLPPETPLNIEITVAEFNKFHIELAQNIATDLASVGFNVELRPIHPSHYAEILVDPVKNYQLIIGTLPLIQTTNSFLTGVLHSRGAINLSDHRDGTLDLMIEEQISEMDDNERTDKLLSIQEHILANGYMFTPVTSGSYWVYSNDIENFYPRNALSEYSHWSKIWRSQ